MRTKISRIDPGVKLNLQNYDAFFKSFSYLFLWSQPVIRIVPLLCISDNVGLRRLLSLQRNMKFLVELNVLGIVLWFMVGINGG